MDIRKATFLRKQNNVEVHEIKRTKSLYKYKILGKMKHLIYLRGCNIIRRT